MSDKPLTLMQCPRDLLGFYRNSSCSQSDDAGSNSRCLVLGDFKSSDIIWSFDCKPSPGLLPVAEVIPSPDRQPLFGGSNTISSVSCVFLSTQIGW